MEKLISLGVFLGLVVLTAALGGQFTGGEWYQAMHQPAWNPPAVVMASVWAVSYVLMAVSAWMVWETIRGLASVALGLWVLQLVLGVCWSWMYFGLHRPGWALGVMAFWLLAILVVTGKFRSIKPDTTGLMIPVAVWLLFFLLLNFIQWHLNGGGLGSVL